MLSTTNEPIYLPIGLAEKFTGYSRRTLLEWTKSHPKTFPHRINESGKKEFSLELLKKHINPKKFFKDETIN